MAQQMAAQFGSLMQVAAAAQAAAMQTPWQQQFPGGTQPGVGVPTMQAPAGYPQAPSVPSPGLFQMPGMPAAPVSNPCLTVSVEGIDFQYQLTEDDVRKVFTRYGAVNNVGINADGSSASVFFDNWETATIAQRDLDGKSLSGLAGGQLRVSFEQNSQPPAPTPAFNSVQGQYPVAYPMQPPQAPWGQPMPDGMGMMPPAPGPVFPQQFPGAAVPLSPSRNAKKFTCKIEIGNDYDKDFRVSQRVINQVARKIWKDIAQFQEQGGKTRLRGKGSGFCEGPDQKEAKEPLQLCISCKDANHFFKAKEMAQRHLEGIHEEYRQFCSQRGLPVPALEVKINDAPGLDIGDGPEPGYKGAVGDEQGRGVKPPGAPSEEEIMKEIERRNETRRVGNYKEADNIRDTLKARGVVLMDEKGARGKGHVVTRWRYWRP